jgi:hypothetical protein
VKAIPLPKARNQKPTKDPHHVAAIERGKAAVAKLQQQGIIDSEGAGSGRIFMGSDESSNFLPIDRKWRAVLIHSAQSGRSQGSRPAL